MNKVYLTGKLDGDRKISVKRESGKTDIVNVLCTALAAMPTIELAKASKGTILVSGKYKAVDDEQHHKHQFVEIDDAILINKRDVDVNEFYFNGVVVANKGLRTTPLTNKVICDAIIVIDEKNYVPCLAFGSIATLLSKCNPGTKIVARARCQSREYNKDDNIKTAFEVVIQEIYQIINGDK